MKAQINVADNTRHLVRFMLQKEAEAALVMSKQTTVVLLNSCVKWQQIKVVAHHRLPAFGSADQMCLSLGGLDGGHLSVSILSFGSPVEI